jgi:hypothetical protein
MTKIRPVTLGPSHSVLALSFLLACSAQATRDGDNDRPAPTRGGSTGNGGTVGAGASTGGTFTPPNPTGGTTGTPNGGSGGAAAAGAVGTTGGIVGQGGVATTGGAVGTTGGIISSGGGAPTAGSTGTGGSTGLTVTCDGEWAVGNDGFVKAKGAGTACWHGYAFTGKSTGSTVMPADYAKCGTGCMLCATGTVAKSDDSSEVAFLGFNVKQVPGMASPGTAKPTGAGVTVSFKKTGDFPLRVQIQAKAATAATRWCYNVTGTSPVTIPYKSFNTKCWDDSGAAYDPATNEIESILLLIPGGTEEDVAYNACLEGVKDG